MTVGELLEALEDIPSWVEVRVQIGAAVRWAGDVEYFARDDGFLEPEVRIN